MNEKHKKLIVIVSVKNFVKTCKYNEDQQTLHNSGKNDGFIFDHAVIKLHILHFSQSFLFDGQINRLGLGGFLFNGQINRLDGFLFRDFFRFDVVTKFLFRFHLRFLNVVEDLLNFQEKSGCSNFRERVRSSQA